MDIQPKDLHQRAPLFIGSKNMVERVEKLIAEMDGVAIKN
jgi:fructose-1,6-bisphosphatase